MALSCLKNGNKVGIIMSKNEELHCEICGKMLETNEVYQYEHYEVLCWNCKNEQEELDDGILFI